MTHRFQNPTLCFLVSYPWVYLKALYFKYPIFRSAWWNGVPCMWSILDAIFGWWEMLWKPSSLTRNYGGLVMMTNVFWMAGWNLKHGPVKTNGSHLYKYSQANNIISPLLQSKVTIWGGILKGNVVSNYLDDFNPLELNLKLKIIPYWQPRHSMGKFSTKAITSRQHGYPELQSKAWNATGTK